MAATATAACASCSCGKGSKCRRNKLNGAASGSTTGRAYGSGRSVVLKPGESARNHVIEIKDRGRGAWPNLPIAPSYLAYDYPYYYSRGHYPTHIGSGLCLLWLSVLLQKQHRDMAADAPIGPRILAPSLGDSRLLRPKPEPSSAIGQNFLRISARMPKLSSKLPSKMSPKSSSAARI